MRKYFTPLLLLMYFISHAQVPVDVSAYNRSNGAQVNVTKELVQVSWPLGEAARAVVLLNLHEGEPLFKSIGISSNGAVKEIAGALDPGFILTIGKRDLVSQNGWNIFFDKVPNKPHQSYIVELRKQSAKVTTDGSRTIVSISELHAANFKGHLEITCYNGSPLFNVAAVMSTEQDSTAILYDAGLLGETSAWSKVAWSDTKDQLQSALPGDNDSSRNIAVKYRTIIGENKGGSLAVFPAPHQYFYPLDEAFNLRFTWYGNDFRGMLRGFGLGIRQDPEGDHRYVPWFNAPPGTKQRLNFFCLMSAGKAGTLLPQVKRFTHNDTYKSLAGYKTLASHFHNEFVMSVVLAGKPVPDSPNFVKVFKNMGVDIVHLAEFHYTAHPKGPDDQRLAELKALFDQCKRLSDSRFLLLPGEEPNEFFGGHWLQFFPKPIYWIMSRKPDQPFVTNDPAYGKVYRISNKEEMLRLLELENGLAWTAHPRTKGSTGFPDKYKTEPFFLSGHFMGAAWKHIPADLSLPRLGKRALAIVKKIADTHHLNISYKLENGMHRFIVKNDVI